MSKNILWFCRTSDSSSLSRITDTVLPLLKSRMNITLLSNKTALDGIKNVVLGSDSGYITYKKFIKDQKFSNDNEMRVANMKYILVQIVDLIYENDFDYLFICNGIYEIDWFVKILKSSKNYLTNKLGKTAKLVVWSPLDYIPSKDVINNAIKADLFLTMTPVMLEEIFNLMDYNVDISKMGHVGHGSDIMGVTNGENSDISSIINEMRTAKKVICKNPISVNDIIILNANNYGPLKKDETSVINTSGTRKRLDITVKAFIKLTKTNPGIKLWIHTNLRAFFEMLSIEGIMLSDISDNLILSNNNLSNEELTSIYRACKISIQTSTGEGWSLTNIEAALHRSLQVVPDFLACGYHFRDSRGILIPVTRKIVKNEGDIDVTIGEVSVSDTVECLQKAIDLIGTSEYDEIVDRARDYAQSYTWSNITDQLYSIITGL